MNVNGIWWEGHAEAGTVWLPVNEWIGFSRKITLSTAKTLYIGVAGAGDNAVRLKLNGTIILDTTGGGVDFRTWSIFP